MKLLLCLASAAFSFSAHAYTADELRGDCLAAEEFYAAKANADPYQSIRGARCMAYVAGFADGYAVSDYLAEKVGVTLNAICLPKDKDLPYRLVRSVLVHLERTPPKISFTVSATGPL